MENTNLTISSTSNSNDKGDISIKIQRGSEIRRFSVSVASFTFEELLNKIVELFHIPLKSLQDGGAFVFSYVDDEGDNILVSSTVELEEGIAQAQFSKVPLKIIIKEKETTRKPKKHPTNTTTTPSADVPSSSTSSSTKESKRDQGSQLHHNIIKLFTSGKLEDLEKARELLLQQVELLPQDHIGHYNLACAHSLVDGFTSVLSHLQKAVSLTPESLSYLWNGSSKTPSDSSQSNQDRWNDLHKRALDLFKSGRIEDLQIAKSLIFQQIELQPKSPVSYYNLACAESLLGESSNALNHLQKSIDLGYNNVRHLKKDSDLLPLHTKEQFWVIVRQLEEKLGFRCPKMSREKQILMEWQTLHDATMKLFEKQLFTEAKVLLHKQIALIPNHCTSMYNLACAEAQLKEISPALQHLQQAVGFGFKNVNHIKTDEDLFSLHPTNEFWEIINSIEKDASLPLTPNPNIKSEEVVVEKTEEPVENKEEPVEKKEEVTLQQQQDKNLAQWEKCLYLCEGDAEKAILLMQHCIGELW